MSAGVEAMVRDWLEPLERELDAIFGPDRGRVRAEWLNRRFHAGGGFNFLPMNTKKQIGVAIATGASKAVKGGF